MTRLIILAAAVLGLLLITAVGAVATIAYSPAYFAEIRALLSGAPCPAPCFMGIRPAHTGVNQAYEQLQAHPWVEEAIFWDIRLQFSIEWRWNGRQPAYLRDRPEVEIRDRVEIEYIAVPTTLTIGELWLAMGRPDSTTVGLLSGLVYYPQYGFFARVGTTCRRFWQEPLTLYYVPRQPTGELNTLQQMRAQACYFRPR